MPKEIEVITQYVDCPRCGDQATLIVDNYGVVNQVLSIDMTLLCGECGDVTEYGEEIYKAATLDYQDGLMDAGNQITVLLKGKPVYDESYDVTSILKSLGIEERKKVRKPRKAKES